LRASATGSSRVTCRDQSGKAGAICTPVFEGDGTNLAAPVFAANLTGREVLRDHRVRGTPVLPGFAHLELARGGDRAGISGRNSGGVRLERVVWSRPLTVDAPQKILIRLQPHGAEQIAFEIGAANGAGVQPGFGDLDRDASGALGGFDRGCGWRWNGHASQVRFRYTAFRAMGLDYGPAHRGLDSSRTDGNAGSGAHRPAARS